MNQMDEQALTLIEAQKQLEGVTVVDPDKVINDFKNNKLYQPALEADDYDFTNQVPTVSKELAQRYVEMRQQIRRQRALDSAQQRINSTTSAASSNISNGFYNRRGRTAKSATTKGLNAIRRKVVQSAKNGKQFLKVSGHEMDK